MPEDLTPQQGIPQEESNLEGASDNFKFSFIDIVSTDSSTITRDTLPPMFGQFYQNGGETRLYVNVNNSVSSVALADPASTATSTSSKWEVNASETRLIAADVISMQAEKIVNLVNPSYAQDAVTKSYADTHIVGLGYTLINASSTGALVDNNNKSITFSTAFVNSNYFLTLGAIDQQGSNANVYIVKQNAANFIIQCNNQNMNDCNYIAIGNK